MFRCSPADEAEDFACLCHSPAFARLNALVEQRFSRRAFLAGAAAAGTAALWPGVSAAAIPAAPATPVVFTNIKLFDGKAGKLIEGRRVTVEGNRIKSIEPVS
ncbi:amidohydrolase family protein, partial [Rhizobiaceae sp. 2RAB30]